MAERIPEQSLFQANDYIHFCLKKHHISSLPLPKQCILGFIPHIYTLLKQKYNAKQIDYLHARNPLSLFNHNNVPCLFVYPGTGAPMATIIMDELIHLGVETFLFLGPAGVITNEVIHPLMVVQSALIDEGTSRHYHVESDLVHCDTELTDKLSSFLNNHNIDFNTGAVWTTDAPYREVPTKLTAALDKGCLAVDMEASALIAVSQFYKKTIAGFLLPQDKIDKNGWSHANLNHNSSFKLTKILKLAADFISEC